MGFPPQAPGFFNEMGVSSVPDSARGVYGLYRDGTWVYVGKGEIKNRLLAHLRGDNSCITRERPAHFFIEPTVLRMDLREIELIRELDPICNRRLG